MQQFRRLLRTDRTLAALIVVAAMLLRLLVPAGFMPVTGASGVALTICPGTAPAAAGTMHHMGGRHEAPAAGGPCAFADLALPLIGAADPILPAAAIAFVAVPALARRLPSQPRAAARLRPPSHAPPAAA